MNTRPVSQPLETDLTLRLPSFGMLMDEMEAGRTPMVPRHYRKAAAAAAALIEENTKHPDVRQACTRSPALAQLMHNALISRAAAGGKMKWLHSMKF